MELRFNKLIEYKDKIELDEKSNFYLLAEKKSATWTEQYLFANELETESVLVLNKPINSIINIKSVKIDDFDNYIESMDFVSVKELSFDDYNSIVSKWLEVVNKVINPSLEVSKEDSINDFLEGGD